MPLISESAMSAIKTRFGYNKSKQIDPVESSAVQLLKSSSSMDLMQKSASKFLFQSSSKSKSDDGETASYDVPRTFEFSEDPSFWKDHNVQVIIRVRPLNSSELSTQGQNRCVKQDSSQSVTWLGHPETRFTFDIVADESVSQEMLFKVAGVRLVENCMEGYNSCMFAYGQTGSGKTHTMLGDIEGGARRHSVNCGMTPRVFEYLFSRIQKDKDARREEKLKFTCKCSFLEIYNEQILDLLDPSSANLQIREDTKKGVYVENLTEVEVTSARDVIQQLIQGAANRKVAATNMNHASSRSHSVFTCIIESKWESQGVTHYRFARLNLVDLAGSERQKSSGAEGERLKEATNINKSLSTLGLVIMNLVSISNGKSLHVPYRDSKLTFLLQDSLGGNAKTIMIANISPSTSCSLETLSTLKFAQRAKFIKNHAIVNEDASGDVLALRLENQHLKKEVSRLRSLVNEGVDSQGADALSLSFPGSPGPFKWDGNLGFSSPLMPEKKLSHLQKKEYEVALVGAFRREKDKDMALQALTEEHQKAMHLNKQREDENQGLKMRLRFREAGIKRLEAVASGKISAETHLLKEKEEHLREIEVLRAQVDRNQDATRFAMENLRLSEEIRRLKSFCEEGERERMDEQLMIMQNKLLEALDWKLMNESGPANIQNDLLSDTNFLSSNQESSSPWRTTMNEENEFLRMQAIQNQSELDSLRKKLEFCIEEKEKLARNVDDLAKDLEVERSSKNITAERMQTEAPSVMNSHIPSSDQMEIKTMVDAIAAASQREAEAHEMAIFLSKENDGLNMKLKVLIEDNNKLIDLYERAAAENNSKSSGNSRNLQDDSSEDHSSDLRKVAEEKELEMQQECDRLKRQLTEMHKENDKVLGLYEKAMQEREAAENNNKSSVNSLNLQDNSNEDHSTDLSKVAEENELEMQQECDSLRCQLTEMHEENDKLLGLYEKAMQDSSEDHSTHLSKISEEKELEMQQECDSLKRQLTEMHEENDKLLGLYEKAMQERDEFKRVVAAGQQKTPYEKTEFTCPEKLVEIDGGQCLQFDEASALVDDEFEEVESVIPHAQNKHNDLDLENLLERAQLCDVHVQVDSKANLNEDLMSKGLTSVRKKLIEAQEKLSYSAQTVNMFVSLERALIEVDELSEKIEKLECGFQEKQKEMACLKVHSSELWERKDLANKKLSALKNSMSSFSASLSYFEKNEAVARFNVNALSQNLARRKEKVSSLQVSKYETTDALLKLQQTKIDLKSILHNLMSKVDEENREVENVRVLFPIDNVEKPQAIVKATELLKTEEDKLKLQSQIKTNTKKLADVRKEAEVANRKLIKIESEMKVLEIEVQKDVLSVDEMERKLQGIIHQKEMLLEVNENGREEFDKMIVEYYQSFFEAELKEGEIKFVDEELVVESQKIEDLQRAKVEAAKRKRHLVESMGCDLSFVSDKVEEDLHDIAMSVKELNYLIESCSLVDC